MDLLSHRVIKVNGCYAVTGDFFRNAYRGGKLNGTIVFSETCEFYGRSGHVNTALSDGLLSGGAKAVAGFINNVYSVYSRSMLWATVNRLIEGETLQQAIDYSLEVYGENDIVWYLNQNTGRRPHPGGVLPHYSGRWHRPAHRARHGNKRRCRTADPCRRLTIALLTFYIILRDGRVSAIPFLKR